MADDLPELRIDHVLRPPLPWRRQQLTECGLPIAGHPVIDRDEAAKRFRDLGRQRASFTLCVTCIQTAGRWPTWEKDPVGCLQRETYGGRRAESLKFELQALAILVEAHREQYDQLLYDLTGAIQLEPRRKRGLQTRRPFDGAS